MVIYKKIYVISWVWKFEINVTGIFNIFFKKKNVEKGKLVGLELIDLNKLNSLAR